MVCLCNAFFANGEVTMTLILLHWWQHCLYYETYILLQPIEVTLTQKHKKKNKKKLNSILFSYVHKLSTWLNFFLLLYHKHKHDRNNKIYGSRFIGFVIYSISASTYQGPSCFLKGTFIESKICVTILGTFP
jgi:hypothetical protein